MDIGELGVVAATLEEYFARGVDVDSALDGFGWKQMAQEFPHDAVSLLFTAQGRAAGNSSALAWVTAAPLLEALGLATEEHAPAVVLPASAPGGPVLFEGDKVTAHGVYLPGTEGRVVLTGQDVNGTARLAFGSWEQRVEAVAGMDDRFAGQVLAGEVFELQIEQTLTGAVAVDATRAALAAGRRGVAHELNGVMMRMLELAVEHAMVRTQFGVRIGSYQAVQHRLAEARVRLQASWDAADAAWDDCSEHSALVAKALAGRTLRHVSSDCQQVLAGMGFTGEHFFSTLFRHGFVRDFLLGSGDDLRRQLGESVLARRAVLPVPALGRDLSDNLARFELFRTTITA